MDDDCYYWNYDIYVYGLFDDGEIYGTWGIMMIHIYEYS